MRKVFTVKGKILMTVLTVVLLFALFILFYFPARQEQSLIKNYNEEVEQFAKTVALGVKIAIKEENYEGVTTAIDFVRNDERLVFVSWIQTDTIPSETGDEYSIQKTILQTFPDSVTVDPDAVSNDQFIIKSAPFVTDMMSGEILLCFSTKEIVESLKQIRLASITASLIVFVIGLAIGYLLARNISKPVLALRDAANRVGEGDLTQSVTTRSNDEIGELGIAFNKMVKDLSIEASLERVRAKALAMRYSKDLEITIASLFYELDHIGFASEYSGIGIINPKKKRAEFWTTNNPNGERESLGKGDISLEEHAFLRGMYNAWEHQSYYVYVLIGEDYHSYYEQFKNSGVQLPEDSLKESAAQSMQYCYTVMFKAGGLTIFRSQPLDDSNMKTLQRFADVFHLAYTRFHDLRKAEISAIEELKQASLDRVRGEIASMRTKEDLEKITHVVWRELTTLGVSFIRCGVFIVDEPQQIIHSYLSSPSGASLGIFNLAFNANAIAKKIIDHWHQRKAYSEHWDKAQFMEFISSLVKQGQIENQNSYLGSVPAPDVLELHFFPFAQGMLYVGNTSPLVNEELELSQSLAKAFSMAYARYEDFIQLESAKNAMEKTLGELKSTQSQLIHSEKMASLGELTAGIAHEIQNPLNFVNNFSEVNKELIDEMKHEIDAGNFEEAKALAMDIETNEEKINHHGKRADAIVKGMLQHSRTSTGAKEPTDLNVLADEYLRLAYHGLRAKDKNFNASMQTDFDPALSIDQGGTGVPIIPQDFGRVILNLITNAFYAVTEKKNAGTSSEYEPIVAIRTKKKTNNIEITITDNGDGIPENIIDKIFQPFFTTKPTGKGTGLGLSMSYDIITHGHGGELKVETKSGNGTSFLIILPH